ncbi:MAG: hypothetical protein ABI954_00950 [Pyrinomonadaceae bacterium]
MASENVQSKRVGDLQYEIKTRIVKKGQRDGINYQNDVLYIDYEVKNLGDKNYLVFNQGHNDKDDRNVVYVEPQSDSSIELSQKAFVQPRDKNCPLYDAPILPRAAWLKARQTVKNQVSVELPLKFKTPFADCSPQPEMPKESKTVRFCLGVAEADPKTVKVGNDGSFQDMEAVKKQQVLCSESINLK